MAWWMAAAVLTKGIIGADADQRSTRAFKKSLDRSAKDKIKAADSVLYASVINRSLADLRGRQTQASQVVAFASSGVDITSGSVISTLASTETQMLRNDFLSKQNAQADADLLLAEAGQLRQRSKLAGKNLQNRQLQNIIGTGIEAIAASE